MKIKQLAKTSVLFIFLFFNFLLSAESFAAAKITPLPAAAAFVFSASVTGKNQVMATWNIAPDYYLYRQRIHFKFSPATAADIHFPQGELKYDNEGKHYEAYAGVISIPIILKTQEKTVQLSVDYQGCSKRGFCYPPMHQTASLNLTNGAVSASSLSGLLTNQTEVRALFGMQHFATILLIFAGLGLLLAFTPCVLPMLPILSSIIVGQEKPSVGKSFCLALVYVLGSALTYAAAGVLAASIGYSLSAFLQKPWILAMIAGLFVLFALSLFGFFMLPIPRRWQNWMSQWSHQQKKGTYAGVFCMGSISALILSPCVTAPLVGVLLYIADTGDRVLGGSALFVMGFSMGLPLLLLGASAGKWLPRSGEWLEGIKKGFGIVMLVMAVWLSSRAIGLTLPAHPMTTTSSFVVVHDLASFNQELAKAKALHKPVMLDFYADWCESCVIMDRTVFNVPEVKQALNNYVRLRADLSKNNEADQRLLQYFKVIAPPTVIFFSTEGKELETKRLVGDIKATEFLARLKKS